MKRVIFSALFVAATFAANGANETTAEVSFDLNTQRFIGESSTLDRNKYFNIHSTGDRDPDVAAFFKEYDVHIGRSFSSPLDYAGHKAGRKPCVYDVKLPNENPVKEGVRPIGRNYVVTGHVSYLHGEMDTKAAGEFSAKYFANVKNYDYPSIYEPINEAFVHAKDKKFRPTSTEQMKVVISEYYRDAARAIRKDPYLANMKVIGDGAAYPSYEIANFKQFNDNTKVFLDIAGRDMDAISVHLYDGVNIEGQATKRSGSNSEAILDLLECYTAANFGEAKPLAVTEFGGIIKIPGTGDDGSLYHEDYSPLVVLSMNHIYHNLMERQDNMLFSVAFIGDKATWYLNSKNNPKRNSYTSVLFTPKDRKAYPRCEWVINEKVYLFELWKGVNGDRIDIKCDNPDIQAMAFRDGKRLYIAMDNLHDKAISTSLKSIAGTSQFKNVELRSLKGVWGEGLTYETRTIDINKPLEMQPDECVMVVIDLKKSTPYRNSITRTKYYSPDHLKSIEAGEKIDFAFGDKLPQGDGRVAVRMSIGRPIALSKTPKVWVNGTAVEMPTNWKGYDQADRKDFFGMIKIPFDMSLLKASNNTITLEFPDSGGSVSSMILEQETYKK